jgi:hypothetical protein
LGYDSDFDPQADLVVRIQARRLRRVLDQYYDNQGVTDPIRIDIPKGSYVPVFLPNREGTQDAEPASEPSDSTSATIEPQYALPDGPSIAVLPLVYLGMSLNTLFWLTE